MTTLIDLGTNSGRKSVRLDLGKLIATRALVCANSGAGKSYLIRKIVEGALPTIPTIILDREGEFATLREHFDVALIGPGGEAACAVATAAKLARRLIEMQISAVIDLSDLAMADKRRFVRLFLESLIALPRELWHPTLIVIDEAHQFAPESGREAESLPAVVALMDQGRKRGFGTILATQRLAKLHKDAAAEANNIFVGRFAQDVDLKRAGELLGFSGREPLNAIRTSDPGLFYALGPALVEPGVERFLCGPVKTTHPDPQHRHAVKPPQPSRKILAVAGELADLKAQVEAEANELETLRAKVREQAATIAKLGKPAAAPSVDRAALEEASRGAQHAERKRRINECDLELVKISAAIERWRERNARMLAVISDRPPRSDAEALAIRPASAPRRAAKTVRVVGRTALDSRRGAKWTILTALVQHGPLDRRSIGLLTCLVSTAGSFGNVLGELKGLGWIRHRPDGTFEAMAAGVEALGDYTPLPTGNALVAAWRKKFGGGTLKMFDALVTNGPMTRAELGRVTGLEHSAGSFGNNLGAMRKQGVMVDIRDDGDRKFAIDPLVLGGVRRRAAKGRR